MTMYIHTQLSHITTDDDYQVHDHESIIIKGEIY